MIFLETFLKFLPRKIDFLGEYKTLGVLLSTSRCCFGQPTLLRGFGEVLLLLSLKKSVLPTGSNYETKLTQLKY